MIGECMNGGLQTGVAGPPSLYNDYTDLKWYGNYPQGYGWNQEPPSSGPLLDLQSLMVAHGWDPNNFQKVEYWVFHSVLHSILPLSAMHSSVWLANSST